MFCSFLPLFFYVLTIFLTAFGVLFLFVNISYLFLLYFFWPFLSFFIPCFILSVRPPSELFLFSLQHFELCFFSFLFVPLPLLIISFVLSLSSHPYWSSVEGKDWSPCCARSQVTLRECNSIVCRSEWPSVQCWGRWTRSCWQPGYGNGHVNWAPHFGSPAFSLVTAYFFRLVLVLWMTWSHLHVVFQWDTVLWFCFRNVCWMSCVTVYVGLVFSFNCRNDNRHQSGDRVLSSPVCSGDIRCELVPYIG